MQNSWLTWFRPPSAGNAVARPQPYCLRSLFLFAALFLSLSAVGQESTSDVRYTVSLARRSEHLVHVTMQFACSGQCEVQLPVWNALYQVRDFAQYVRNITDSGDPGRPARTLDKTTWQVSRAGSEATVEYDYLAELPPPFGAELNEHHGFFNLALLLMYPVGQRNHRTTVNFVSLPSDWRIAAAFRAMVGGGPRNTTYVFENYDRMVDTPFEIGNFKGASFQEGDAAYQIVVDADPSDYDMSALVEQNRKIVRAETEWMQDLPFRSYVFIYHFPHGPAGGGMEHANSTAICASAERLKNNPNGTADVSAHEFFHLWNVKRIRPQSLEPVDYTKEQYSTALWFSEGVTSTVGELMLVRAGLKTEEQFLKGVADEIEDLQSRPAHRTQSAEESSLETWFDKYPIYHLPERSISYYNKGFILGVLLDLAIRDATHGQKSLRDLFLYLNQNYAKQGRFFANSVGVREAAEAVAGTSFQEFFSKYVAGTDEIPYDDYFRSVGLKLEIHQRETADPGFTASRGFEPTRTVIAVEPESEAAKAGLRVGDVIAQINGKVGAGSLEALFESMKPGDTVKLKVMRARSTHDVQFRLGSRTEDEYALVDLPQITPEQRDRRRQWVHGESGGTAPR